MDLDLQDRVFIITDVEPGLGAPLARALNDEGARVVSSITASKVAQTNVAELVAQADAEWGRLDGGLVFVPATTASGSAAQDASDDEWTQSFHGTFLRVVDTLRRISRALPAGGSLVVVLGSAIYEPTPGGSVVEDAFGRGLATLILQLAGELGPLGVRANGLLMGPLADDGVQQGQHGAPFESTAARCHSDDVPLRRFGSTEEFARVATFLLSPAASYISGTLWPVDGGLGRYG